MHCLTADRAGWWLGRTYFSADILHGTHCLCQAGRQAGRHLKKITCTSAGLLAVFLVHREQL